MTVRNFSGSEIVPAAVEQFSTGRTRGCIVRWDFGPIMVPVRSNNRWANFRRRKTGESTRLEPQEMRDSGIVAFSEARYIGKPDPERVVADIESDIALRYGDSPHPEIDFKFYRDAIAALPEP